MIVLTSDRPQLSTCLVSERSAAEVRSHYTYFHLSTAVVHGLLTLLMYALSFFLKRFYIRCACLCVNHNVRHIATHVTAVMIHRTGLIALSHIDVHAVTPVTDTALTGSHLSDKVLAVHWHAMVRHP